MAAPSSTSLSKAASAAAPNEPHAVDAAVAWLRASVTGTLHCDSRAVGAGDGFIAWPGAATDGRRFVGAALAQGAAACLVEREGADAYGFTDPRVAAFPHLKAATGPIAAAWFDRPSEALDVLAVTGTNGKTSTAWWLAQALTAAGRATGMVGTLGIGTPPRAVAADTNNGTDNDEVHDPLADIVSNGLTTPDPVQLQRGLRAFADEGFVACAIEASSIGIAEHRLDGTRIRVAIFTNFTQDHLDYHHSMRAYWEAKARLFGWSGLRAAVVNVDDAQGAVLAGRIASSQGGAGTTGGDGSLDLWTVSCIEPARLVARNVSYGAAGLRFDVAEGAQAHTLQTRLIGQYNVSNLLGVIAAMRAIGVPLADAVAACGHLSPVPGRMDCLGGEQSEDGEGLPLVAVDYAHTPDALEKALAALRPLTTQRGGRLWCVFGCGGDRDPVKRSLMGAAAERDADKVVVTSDNPRSESPEAIVDQVLAGMAQPLAARRQVDRARAIAEAIAAAAPQDVVLIAGKGHEDYQDVAGVKHPFSDKAHAREALKARVAA